MNRENYGGLEKTKKKKKEKKVRASSAGR